jgi:hypothetical protein
MSVFRNIMSRIFRGSTLAPSSAQAATPPAEEAGQRGGEIGGAALPGATPATPGGMPMAPAGTSSAAQPDASPQAAPAQPVDVEAVLTGMAAQNPQKLNWQSSIVDLMKLLDLDSSLASRKELAEELGYTGAKDGSAEMNIWLHRQVMRKLAENGGRVPDSLKG